MSVFGRDEVEAHRQWTMTISVFYLGLPGSDLCFWPPESGTGHDLLLLHDEFSFLQVGLGGGRGLGYRRGLLSYHPIISNYN